MPRGLSTAISTLLVALVILAMPREAQGQGRFLTPLDRYAPRADLLTSELNLDAIASKYNRRPLENCNDAYGPLNSSDMRSLLFYRQATFEYHRRYRWSRSGTYTWYINESSDESYLCGQGKVYCNALYICKSGRTHLQREADKIVAISPPLREMDSGAGVVFRIKTCDQSISKFRHIEILLKSPQLVRNMRTSLFIQNIISSGLHFAHGICPDDGYTYSYPNVRSERKDILSGINDPYSNIQISVFDHSRSANAAGAPIMRIRTAHSARPGIINIREFDGPPGIARITNMSLPDISTLIATPAAELSAVTIRGSAAPGATVEILPAYTAKDIRSWQIYDHMNGDALLGLYRESQVEALMGMSSTLGWLNSLGRDEPPSEVLRQVAEALGKFAATTKEAAAKKGTVWTTDREKGDLYTLYALHRARTKNQPASLPYNRARLVREGFNQAEPAAAAFHTIGLDPRTVEKWEHSDGREYVYTRNGAGEVTQVFDGKNDGTFNFFHSSKWSGHIMLDVFPWILWGATTRDTTTPEQRAVAFRNAFTVWRDVKLGGQITDMLERINARDGLRTGPPPIPAP